MTDTTPGSAPGPTANPAPASDPAPDAGQAASQSALNGADNNDPAIPQELHDAFASLVAPGFNAEEPATQEQPPEAASQEQAQETTPQEQPPETAPQEPSSEPEATSQEQPPETSGTPETPEAQVSTPSAGYTWTEGDQTVTFPDNIVREALQLSDWVQKLPVESRAAIAAVSEGSAIAIPRADYEAFQKWQSAQASTARDADLADFPDEYAAVIKAQRDEIDALKAQFQQPQGQQFQQPQPTTPATQANVNANLDATAAAFDRAAQDYASSHQLTPEELNGLVDDVLASNVLPAIMDSMTTRNPLTGAVLSPPDLNAVLNQALDIMLIRNPTLASSIASRVANSTPETASSTTSTDGGTVQPMPTATAPVGDPVISAKKARAASVASAPSAATAPSPRSVTAMSRNEVIAAMEAELARAGSNQ